MVQKYSLLSTVRDYKKLALNLMNLLDEYTDKASEIEEAIEGCDIYDKRLDDIEEELEAFIEENLSALYKTIRNIIKI